LLKASVGFQTLLNAGLKMASGKEVKLLNRHKIVTPNEQKIPKMSK